MIKNKVLGLSMKFPQEWLVDRLLLVVFAKDRGCNYLHHESISHFDTVKGSVFWSMLLFPALICVGDTHTKKAVIDRWDSLQQEKWHKSSDITKDVDWFLSAM